MKQETNNSLKKLLKVKPNNMKLSRDKNLHKPHEDMGLVCSVQSWEPTCVLNLVQAIDKCLLNWCVNKWLISEWIKTEFVE